MLLNRHRKARIEDVNVKEEDSKNQTNTTKKNTESPKQVKKIEKGDK